MAFNSGSSCLKLLIAGITDIHTIIFSSEPPFHKDLAVADPRLADRPVLLHGGDQRKGKLGGLKRKMTQIGQSVVFKKIDVFAPAITTDQSHSQPSKWIMLAFTQRTVRPNNRWLQGAAISLMPRLDAS